MSTIPPPQKKKNSRVSTLECFRFNLMIFSYSKKEREKKEKVKRRWEKVVGAKRMWSSGSVNGEEMSFRIENVAVDAERLLVVAKE